LAGVCGHRAFGGRQLLLHGVSVYVFRKLGRRLGLPQRAWPRVLRSKWFGIALLVLFFWAYETFSLWDRPIWTAWLIINYFLIALAIDAFFSGASFCKYVCPIGQFQFVASLVSPLEVKVASLLFAPTAKPTIVCAKFAPVWLRNRSVSPA